MSVRATISDSKSDFHKEFPYVIPPIYRKLADELLVELHLLSHQKNFKKSPIFALLINCSDKVFISIGLNPLQLQIALKSLEM